MLPGRPLPPSRPTRRAVLLGAAGAAGTVLLAGCGRGNAGDASSASRAGQGGLAVAEYFDRNRVPAGHEVRLPFGLVDAEGVVMADVPGEVEVAFAPAGEAPGGGTVVARHADGVPRPYYPVRATFPEPGTYDVVLRTGDGTASTALIAVGADTVPVPAPGDRLPAVATPTVADGRGVDPVCTAEPPCPLHAVRLDEALAAGRPVALLVSTPAFCSTAVCGPVLDLVVAAGADLGDAVTLVHAEVYTDLTASRTTEAVDALGLTYEPALFVADAAGTVVERLDVIFDRTEVAAALGRVA